MAFDFFQNTECEYFPCKQVDTLNCLFCFCPLYYADCGGDYSILGNGCKDCSKCTRPHEEDGYEYIIKRIRSVT